VISAVARAESFLVADSAAMRAVAEQVRAYADGGAPVVVCGEHGTGRELVARVLHMSGPRRAAPFVAVRPTFEGADVPRGDAGGDACDDARAARALAAARGGTLLVKDLTDLGAASQRTLLAAIACPDRDVQVVTTADPDLARAVDARIVARPLYEQFAARTIVVPPLRDRREDLPALVERWVAHYSAEIGRTRPAIASRAHARLSAYPWPGNVGELKSTARRLVVRVAGPRIEVEDVDAILPVIATRVPLEDLAFEDMVKAKLAHLLARVDGYPVRDLYDAVLARVERPLFDLVLAHTGGNQVKAAEILGLNRNTLRKKLAELEIR
jgi:two-component system nitrogen regulation response regulator GlnG